MIKKKVLVEIRNKGFKKGYDNLDTAKLILLDNKDNKLKSLLFNNKNKKEFLNILKNNDCIFYDKLAVDFFNLELIKQGNAIVSNFTTLKKIFIKEIDSTMVSQTKIKKQYNIDTDLLYEMYMLIKRKNIKLIPDVVSKKELLTSYLVILENIGYYKKDFLKIREFDVESLISLFKKHEYILEKPYDVWFFKNLNILNNILVVPFYPNYNNLNIFKIFDLNFKNSKEKYAFFYEYFSLRIPLILHEKKDTIKLKLGEYSNQDFMLYKSDLKVLILKIKKYNIL